MRENIYYISLINLILIEGNDENTQKQDSDVDETYQN